MKLRWKYFLILLVASLLPMAIVTAISQKACRRMGSAISTDIHQTLAQSVRRDIVSATENYAMITRRAKTSIEFALRLLVREAAAAMELPAPDMPRIYFAQDFDEVGKAPDDLAPSLGHMKLLKDGRKSAKSVSYRQPNFLLASGVQHEEVRQDIARLSRLTPTLKEITGEFEESLFWIYASLDSGVHISYPGHGGYPPDYDPRSRPWYTAAQTQRRLTWSPPIVDVTTRQATFTVSAPFSRPDGSFAGVAAIDVLLPNVLLQSRISSQWSQHLQSFLVGLSNAPGGGKEQAWVLSEKAKSAVPDESAGNPPAVLELQKGEDDFSKLIRHIHNKKSGSLEMPYQGENSFWAFASIFSDLYFVIIAPESMVMDLPEAVARSFSAFTRGQMFISLAAVLIAILITGGVAFLISQKTTGKVSSIVRGIKRLERGDFTARLKIRFGDERDLIVTTFNHIVPRLEEHLRMSRALDVAKDVQQSLLPQKNPSIPGFDIAGTSIYCDETGGDYYDYIDIHNGRLAVVVGDVSGHGISSALLMATARALIMLRASMPGSAAHIINDVNKHLSLDTYDTGNFMTFFYCELTPASQEICWVRAGHEPAILYDPATDAFDVLKGDGLAFGLDSSFAYEEFTQSLAPGQIVLIGTDGIWEMGNERGEMFGRQRLMDIIRANQSAPAKALIAVVTDALQRFRGSKQPEDDVTMVVIKAARSADR